MTVRRAQRHVRGHPCPVCGGYDESPRGQGKRCGGFTSEDGLWCHCAREELAGGIVAGPDGLFAHCLRGDCNCGTKHGEDQRRDEIETTYDYVDEQGTLLFQVVRLVGKKFRQRRPIGSEWAWHLSPAATCERPGCPCIRTNLGECRRVLYRLPQLLAAGPEQPVYVVEGEKDVGTLVARGQVATCNPAGAGKWKFVVEDAREVLAGRDVVIIADRDTPGRKHGREVRASLLDVARSVKLLVAPAPHKDVTDLLTAGGALEQLVPLDASEGPAGSETKGKPQKPRLTPAAADGTPVPLIVGHHGGIRSIVANVLTVLTTDVDCADLLEYDSFREAVAVRRDPPCRSAERPPVREGNEWSPEDSTRFAACVASKYDLHVTAAQVEEAVATVARKRTVHPVRDWLAGLKWDGKPRIPKLFSTYFGAADSAYHEGIAVCWMVSAVARVHQPGCQVDYLIVLEGKTGTGKTTGLEALAGKDWFSDTALDISSKDGPQCLHGIWVHLFDELEGISGRAAVSRVKNFLSRRNDHYRPSYGRVARTFPRQCVFAATTNEQEYLQDQTGNRRIWPVRCGLVYVQDIERDREQLWAEAVHLYQSGTKWWPTGDLIALCNPEQEQRTRIDAWETVIERWLDKPTEVSLDERGRATSYGPFDISEGLTTADVLVHALGKRIGDCSNADEQRVGTILRKLGYERRRRRREGKPEWRYVMVRSQVEPGPTPGITTWDQGSQPNLPNVQARSQVIPGKLNKQATHGDETIGPHTYAHPYHGESWRSPRTPGNPGSEPDKMTKLLENSADPGSDSATCDPRSPPSNLRSPDEPDLGDWLDEVGIDPEKTH